MTEAMLKVITFCLEHVEGLISNFPSGAAAIGKLRNISRGDAKICYKAVAVGDLTRGIGNLDLEPIDA